MIVAGLVLFAFAPPVAAQTFPALTSRVVDDADILDIPTEAEIDTKLKDLEAKTTNQLVVVTLPSLQGYEIEDYGYRLGRAWGIGQKDKNNGALLIVAPNERKVRIEVGYGLEGTLTDAMTSLVIQNAILPRFRAGDFAGGISRGVDDLVQILSGDQEYVQRAEEAEVGARSAVDRGDMIFQVLMFLFIAFYLWRLFSINRAAGGGRRSRMPWIIPTGGGFGRRLLVERFERRRFLVGRRWRRLQRRRRFVRGRRLLGKLVMKTTTCLTPDEAARISRAIEAAENTTSGEIFVVVAAHSDDYRLVPVLWAAIAALVLVWPLSLFTLLPVGQLLLVQAAIFAVWCVALTPDAIRLRVIPPPLAEANVERAAREQFLGHGVHLTAARTGVLIYVALAERRVEIVADDGIAKKVDQAEWDAIAQTIVTAARNKVLADGLADAVKTAGALLARHFPPSKDDHDELPNRVVQL